METEMVTSQCEEGKHDLCLGYYGLAKGNYPCECSCHKKPLTWEETVLPFVLTLGIFIGKTTVEDVLKQQAQTSWQARQPEIDLLYSLIADKDVAIIDLKSLLKMAKEEIDRLKAEIVDLKDRIKALDDLYGW